MKAWHWFLIMIVSIVIALVSVFQDAVWLFILCTFAFIISLVMWIYTLLRKALKKSRKRLDVSNHKKDIPETVEPQIGDTAMPAATKHPVIDTSVSTAARPSAQPIKSDRRKTWFDSTLESIPRITIVPNPGTQPIRYTVKDVQELEYTRITKRSRFIPLVSIDVETTGLNAGSGEIVEVSAIRYDSDLEHPTDTFTTLIRPKRPIPDDAIKIHGITNEMVADAPTFTEIREQLQDYISGYSVIGFNLLFDLKFLHVAGLDLMENTKYYDVLPLAQRRVNSYNHKLDTLCEHYGLYRSDAHRSLSDALATVTILRYILED